MQNEKMKRRSEFSKLQTDALPLPPLDDVLRDVVVTRHAKERFVQRGNSSWRLDYKSLGRIKNKIKISRVSPDWRQEEAYEYSPDLYLTFPFERRGGTQDEGCLILKWLPCAYNQGKKKYIAKTFFCRLSNDADHSLRLPPIPSQIVYDVASICHCSLDDAREALNSLSPLEQCPEWCPGEGDCWINGGSWSASLWKETVGAGNIYHYSWGKVYSRKKFVKEKNKARYQRRFKNKGK